MLKRTIPLLFAVAVVLVVAVPAEAGHCVRCRFAAPDWQYCLWGVNFGNTDCYEDPNGTCQLIGDPCSHFFASSLTPLSAEFEVASVERIDETPAPNEILVVRLETLKTAAEPTR